MPKSKEPARTRQAFCCCRAAVPANVHDLRDRIQSLAFMAMANLLAIPCQRFTPRAGKASWELNPMVTLRPKGPMPFFV